MSSHCRLHSAPGSALAECLLGRSLHHPTSAQRHILARPPCHTCRCRHITFLINHAHPSYVRDDVDSTGMSLHWWRKCPDRTEKHYTCVAGRTWLLESQGLEIEKHHAGAHLSAILALKAAWSSSVHRVPSLSRFCASTCNQRNW